MANDDRQSEQFIREVDEELRRAQLKAVWDRFAPLIIGACVVVVAVTAGYRGYVWWQERQAAEAGDRFMAALAALESGNAADGEAGLAAIAAEGAGGYPALAELAARRRQGGGRPERRKRSPPTMAWRRTPPLDRPLRDLARARAALIALDMRDFAGASERAEPLNDAGNPWRHTAREILGTAAFAGGDPAGAREIFTEIQQDAETPPDLWARSGLMISLIDGRIAAPAGEAEGGSAPSATPPLANTEEPAVTSPDNAESGSPESTAQPVSPAPQNAIPPQ